MEVPRAGNREDVAAGRVGRHLRRPREGRFPGAAPEAGGLEEEGVDGLAVVDAEAVRDGADEGLRAAAEEAVHAPHLLRRLNDAAGVEEVVLLAEDEDVARGLREEEVAHLQSEFQDARGDLLDVGGEFVLDVVEPGGDIAARRDGDGARVGRGDPGGEGAAARVARHQEARGVDLGAGFQVVEAADGVPGAPGAEPFARERELLAHHVVVGAESAAGVFDVAELLALALLDGVDDEDGEALEDEAEGGGLVGVAGLALLGVAADDKDARDLALPPGGEIEVGRDGPARAAEVVEVLDCVAVVGVGAGHHGVEGRAGREAEDPGDLPPERVDVAAGVGLRADGAEALRAGCVGFPDLVDVVFVDDVAEEGCGRGGGVFHG